MMLKTYPKDHITEGQPDWPLYHLDVEGRPIKDGSDGAFIPGDEVCHVRRGGTGYGIVVAASEDQVVVLWSQEPASSITRLDMFLTQKLFHMEPMLASKCFYFSPNDDAEVTA